MMNLGEFHCACKFYRAEEFGEAKLVEPCSFHAAMQKKLDDWDERWKNLKWCNRDHDGKEPVCEPSGGPCIGGSGGGILG